MSTPNYAVLTQSGSLVALFVWYGMASSFANGKNYKIANLSHPVNHKLKLKILGEDDGNVSKHGINVVLHASDGTDASLAE